MGGAVVSTNSSKASSSQASIVHDYNVQDDISISKSFNDPDVKWKILPSCDEAIKKFQNDGSLTKVNDPYQLELRMMLDDPIAQRELARFAKENKTHDIFMCWVDAHEYKSIPTPDYRRSKALHMYHKYIKTDAILEIGGIDPVEKERIKQQIELSKELPSILQNDLFEKVQVNNAFKQNINFP
jgi:hypothetical protein